MRVIAWPVNLPSTLCNFGLCCCMSSSFPPAVVSAVIFLGDDFGLINAVGLVVLVFGAALFNYSKYVKMMEKDARLVRSPGTHTLFISLRA